MFRYSRCSCSLASAGVSSSRSSWDATVSLSLTHPTLVLLEKCRTRKHFKQILAQMMRIHLITQTFPMSRLLLSATTHPENLDLAILLFHYYTPHPNLYIYNTMISALSFSSSPSMALYKSMLQSCIYPDKQTFVSLLKASKCLSEGKQIHGHAIVMGFSSYAYLQNSLIKMYSENRRMDLAHQVFQLIPEQDVVSWNAMMSGYAKMRHSLEALELFREMVVSGLEPDEFTTVSLLVVCGNLGDSRQGKSIHAWIKRREFKIASNLIVVNSLLDMYVKCEEMELARRVFDVVKERDLISWNTIIAGYATIGEMEIAQRLFNEMPSRDLVSWNALITGYAQEGHFQAVMKLFQDMLVKNIRPDKVTVVSLVSVAALIGSLNEGRAIHGWVVKACAEYDAILGSALIDMYSKCGSIERALLVFERVYEKDVMVWTAMIAGLAFHGYGNKALELFRKMQEELMPNRVTLVAVLTACSHSGLVDQGLTIFYGMKEIYGVEPGVEHYGCLVDLLGRAGMLTEAKDVIEQMPMKPSASIWGAMLNACKVHGDVQLAETALNELVKLEPEKEGGYVLLSNIYAACGKWSHSNKIRGIMGTRGVKKKAGCSSVVVDGVAHEFIAADKRHSRWVEISHMLKCLNGEMRSSSDSFCFLQLLLDLLSAD
eukprot:TRINITY_DN993_c1_g1_i3.p2 TRINITY_DN993_c1_g1~~TRINITY_DN993_c1_g1_i3.p2  ORF type:complete len:658 (-),score=128.87 TRINITY_DN993_c1_g1_i3:4567-6540(-)